MYLHDFQIFDGFRDDSASLQKYCQTYSAANLPLIMTTGPTARVRFHSDDNRSDGGFLLSYSAQSQPFCNLYSLELITAFLNA